MKKGKSKSSAPKSEKEIMSNLNGKRVNVNGVEATMNTFTTEEMRVIHVCLIFSRDRTIDQISEYNLYKQLDEEHQDYYNSCCYVLPLLNNIIPKIEKALS